MGLPFFYIGRTLLGSKIEPDPNDVLYVVACFAVIAAILVWLLGARTERDAIIDLMNFGIEAEVTFKPD